MTVSKMLQRTWDYTFSGRSGLARPMSLEVLLCYAMRNGGGMDLTQSSVSLWVAVMEGLDHDMSLCAPRDLPSEYGFLVGYLLEEEKTTGRAMPAIARSYLNNNASIHIKEVDIVAGRQAYIASSLINYPTLK